MSIRFFFRFSGAPGGGGDGIVFRNGDRLVLRDGSYLVLREQV